MAKAKRSPLGEGSHEGGKATEQGVEMAETVERSDKAVKGRRRVVIVVCALVVLVALIVGYCVPTAMRYNGIDTDYQAARTADSSLTKEAAKAKQLQSETKPEQVQDAKTLDQLKQALDTATRETGVTKQEPNRWLLWKVNEAAGYYTTDKKNAEKATSSLVAAEQAVIKSRDAKALADVQKALADAVAAGEKLFTDSEGKVANPATRDALNTAVTQGKGIQSKAGVSVADTQKATATVNEQMQAVNDSMKAKADADAQAAAEAQAAAQAQAAQATQARQQSSYAPQYRSSGYSSPAPQRQQQAAPAPQQQQQSQLPGMLSESEFNDALAKMKQSIQDSYNNAPQMCKDHPSYCF
ncbi:hypothetical protein KIM372_03330 [Bombiscardovia nodaiensis]|uniref:Colicin transporter n=1 Tax=Bombiscardovia nodaiensis TaxID=2932181 RepID=A0ABM8B6G2_9BIFI|nr:hypothetical protein KIM372_03330 [Bombiscardovia nodaiensis]